MRRAPLMAGMLMGLCVILAMVLSFDPSAVASADRLAFQQGAQEVRPVVAMASVEKPTPLFGRRLDEMMQQFSGTIAGADTRQWETLPQDQQAFIFPSEGVSACVASGCAASACGASGCAGSGCAASACGGSGCGGSICGGSACGGSLCTGSACAGSACGGSACVGSTCAGSACAGSACGGSACGGSACIGSSCGASGCVGSACGLSACGGSACSLSACGGSVCTQSGCAGSVCGNTGCVGSVCNKCSSQQEQSTPVNLAQWGDDGSVVAATCPYQRDMVLAPVHLVAFNIRPLQTGIEVIWSVTGRTVQAYRLLRVSGQQPTLVGQGAQRPHVLTRVQDPQGHRTATYVLELTDRTGWTTRIRSDGRTDRFVQTRGETSSQVAMVAP